MNNIKFLPVFTKLCQIEGNIIGLKMMNDEITLNKEQIREWIELIQENTKEAKDSYKRATKLERGLLFIKK